MNTTPAPVRRARRMHPLGLVALLLLPIATAACDIEESSDCFEAIENHFPESAQARARQIVWRESRNIPTAANPRSSARGCFQILQRLHGWRYDAVDCPDWRDPDCNAKVALMLYEQAGWSPWIQARG